MIDSDPAPDYPAHEASDVVLRSGSTLRLRPIRREDADALRDFEQRLPSGSVYFRFFGADGPDPKTAAAACDVDYRGRYGTSATRRTHRRGGALPARRRRSPRAEVTFAVESRSGARVGTRRSNASLKSPARASGLRGQGPGQPAHARRLRELRIPHAAKVNPGGERVEVALTPTPDFEEKTAHRPSRPPPRRWPASSSPAPWR
jgi:hypothetical protein